ncbi:hypothetical protein BDM02DRAFT_943637 [Thelephora ganbajun]|uniref:Uncharacterized protein n=1 Tax=Thelephora ganbajun TaxID=370292 RepID=A0ACB6Z476_THEGA|nr:hypothetical protein BDM02DRAFT_943637 [Thelephora ganbajun]
MRLTCGWDRLPLLYYRVDYLPVGLRGNTGFVCDMVFPRDQPQGAIGVHIIRAFDGNISFSSYPPLLLLDRYMFAILLGGSLRTLKIRTRITHLYKPFQSLIVYALVVVRRVGHVSLIVQIFTSSLLPFRWKQREPLSSVLYDLMFVHLILPYTIHYFRP